jgi:hypothetical protein
VLAAEILAGGEVLRPHLSTVERIAGNLARQADTWPWGTVGLGRQAAGEHAIHDPVVDPDGGVRKFWPVDAEYAGPDGFSDGFWFAHFHGGAIYAVKPRAHARGHMSRVGQ